MKKSLFATALLVALVGCGQSGDDRMGAPASTESVSRTDTTIRQETIITNEPAATESTTIITPAPAAPTSSQTDVTITPPAPTTDVTITPPPAQNSTEINIQTPPPQPEQPQQPQQDQQPQQQPDQGAANTTGDQSNGDTSNRPAGAPGGAQSSSSSDQQQPQPSDQSGSATP